MTYNSESDKGSEGSFQIRSRFWDQSGSGSSSSSSDDDENDGRAPEAVGDNDRSMGCMLMNDDDDEEEENLRSWNPNYAWEQLRESQVFLEPPVRWIPSKIKNRRRRSTNRISNFFSGSSQPGRQNRSRKSKSKNDHKQVCRFVFISDTHTHHRHLPYLPKGDVLVHAGDFTKSGETGTMQDLSLYFRQLQQAKIVERVICVAGNHDVSLDHKFNSRGQGRKTRASVESVKNILRSDAIYLQDESHRLDFSLQDETANGNGNANANSKKACSINVWGSPYSPAFYDWAFNKERGAPMRDIWNKIPSRSNANDGQDVPIDLLITHGPPLGRGDLARLRSANGNEKITTRAGCYDLLRAIQTRVKPKINVFGHIHEGYGVTYDGTTLYVNASTMNHYYEAVHLPIVVDVDLNLTSSNCNDNENGGGGVRVVKPKSLFCNSTTQISSLEEWIEWCRSHGHETVIRVLQERFPQAACDVWFPRSSQPNKDQEQDECRTPTYQTSAIGHGEPPPDEFFDRLARILGCAKAWNRKYRDLRQALSAMVFHLYALAFDEDEE